MDKKGSLFTTVKEQIFWIFRAIFLVVFALIIILVLGRLLVVDVETEGQELNIATISVQKCLEKTSLKDFFDPEFERCFGFDDIGVKLSTSEDILYENDLFGFNRDLCGSGFLCARDYYVLDGKLVTIEVLIEDE